MAEVTPIQDLARATVVVHPTVLLSVADHYNRTCKGASNKRAVGSLCGEIIAGEVHVTNCYGVPFEEDARDPRVWFLDHMYHDQMFDMMKKVNAKERFVGWYSTGPKIKPADLEIHQLYRKYGKFGLDPLFLIIDAVPKDSEIFPIDAYYCVDEKTSDTTFKRTFQHMRATVGAFEAEEVGVEHLLRDLKNASTSTLATRVNEKLTALHVLCKKLQEIQGYLKKVIDGKVPPNHQIMHNIQDIFNRLPDTQSEDVVAAFAVGTNDMAMTLYVGNLLRTTLALHNLINTKISKDDGKKDKKGTDKDKENKDAKDKDAKDKDAKGKDKK